MSPRKKASKATAQAASRAAFITFSDALGVYLETLGWRAIVVGSPRVQQQPGERDFNYEFVVRFTGGKIGLPTTPERH